MHMKTNNKSRRKKENKEGCTDGNGLKVDTLPTRGVSVNCTPLTWVTVTGVQYFSKVI